MLLLKCICDAAEFTFLLCYLLQEEHGVFLGKFSRAVLAERSAPLGQASKRAPRSALRD